MKSFAEIANRAKPKDYYAVAELAGCSYKTIKYAVLGRDGKHVDNYNIQKLFSDYLDKTDAVNSQLKRKYRRKEVVR